MAPLSGMVMLVGYITYIPANGEKTDLQVVGYHVYRDGVRLTATPVTDTYYKDNVAEAGTYSYQVSAVYAEGESALSVPFVLTAT